MYAVLYQSHAPCARVHTCRHTNPAVIKSLGTTNRYTVPPCVELDLPETERAGLGPRLPRASPAGGVAMCARGPATPFPPRVAPFLGVLLFVWVLGRLLIRAVTRCAFGYTSVSRSVCTRLLMCSSLGYLA